MPKGVRKKGASDRTTVRRQRTIYSGTRRWRGLVPRALARPRSLSAMALGLPHEGRRSIQRYRWSCCYRAPPQERSGSDERRVRLVASGHGEVVVLEGVEEVQGS